LAFPWGEIGLGSQKAKALVLWFSEPANKELEGLQQGRSSNIRESWPSPTEWLAKGFLARNSRGSYDR